MFNDHRKFVWITTTLSHANKSLIYVMVHVILSRIIFIGIYGLKKQISDVLYTYRETRGRMTSTIIIILRILHLSKEPWNFWMAVFGPEISAISFNWFLTFAYRTAISPIKCHYYLTVWTKFHSSRLILNCNRTNTHIHIPHQYCSCFDDSSLDFSVLMWQATIASSIAETLLYLPSTPNS